jgi:hypothetical protein
MPSSIRENLDRELRVRGGVTLGLGPLMVNTYGASDLRKELVRRMKDGAEASDLEGVREALLLNISVGGVIGKRELTRALEHESLVDLVIDSAILRDPNGGILKELADEPTATVSFKDRVNEVSETGLQPTRDQTRFVRPRDTIADAGKKTQVGRNEPCPCGSGKKFKKCHMGAEEHVGSTDAPGTPGMTPSEAFWFRDFSDELGKLCHKRLTDSGARAGDTLFWPVSLAPADEIDLRAAIAIARGSGLLDVLERGWELGCFSPAESGPIVLRAYPPAGWFTEDLFNWLRQIPPVHADEITLFGTWTGCDVLALRKAKATTLNALLAGLAEGAKAINDACALAVAGHDRLAYVALQAVRGSGETLDADSVRCFLELEKVLAPRFGRPVLGVPELSYPTPRTELRTEKKSLQQRITELKREVAREQDLRRQIQAAWSKDDRTSGEDTLRAELRRLREELKTERQTAREALRDVQRFRQRERIRLIQESHLEADVVAALVDEATPSFSETSAPEREIVYFDEFESEVHRIPQSTLLRLREQVESFACGGRVREAKRMEALDGVWTLRAGLHYRVILRLGADRIEVMNLIPREDLENTLSRLRR